MLPRNAPTPSIAPVRRRFLTASLAALSVAAAPAALAGQTATAAGAGTDWIAATDRPLGWAVLAIFAIAYLFVALEERIGLSKSKPVMLAAALAWGLVAWSVRGDPAASLLVSNAFERMFLAYAELFFFLVVSMAYVEAMAERGVFDALRGLLARRGLGYRGLFWATGLLAFVLSSVLNNLSTALVVGAVVLAAGKDSPRFVALSCVNIVVAANAGGAWSAFGDVTTLMVWEARHAEFFDFLRLFPPAAANWLVPALAMHVAVPAGKPQEAAAPGTVKFGGAATCALFALTIAITVACNQTLRLPQVFGMLTGLALLQALGYVISRREPARQSAEDAPDRSGYSIFHVIARAEWDTLLFFYGVLLTVGALATVGYLHLASGQLYGRLGATAANTVLGMLSAIVDNIPIMSAVLQMNPPMNHAQWLLVTLTCGVGGSLLSIGSAAGVALMGAARGRYTFMSHLRWSWAIALGFVAGVVVHLAMNAAAIRAGETASPPRTVPALPTPHGASTDAVPIHDVAFARGGPVPQHAFTDET